MTFPHLQRLNRGRQRQNPVTLPRAVIVEVSPVSSVTRRRRFKNNSTPVQHGDYMGRLSAKESGSRPDLMLWKFQPLYLRSTDLVSERGWEWAMEALQRRGRMPGLFNRTAENDWLNPTPVPMKPLAKSKRQHVSHSTANTNALCAAWRRDMRLTEPDCQVTDNQNMLSSLCHFGIFTHGFLRHTWTQVCLSGADTFKVTMDDFFICKALLSVFYCTDINENAFD